MGTSSLLRQQAQFAHRTVTSLIQDIDDDLANWEPGGVTNRIGAMLFHALMAEDRQVHRLQDKPALLDSAGFAERLGTSSGSLTDTLPPVRMDVMREYAQAVFAAADAYLESASDAEMEREVEMAPGRVRQVAATLTTFIVTHLCEHAGEISCIKGLKGLKGY